MTAILAGVAGPTLLAHQGGWDEIAMVAVPVLLIAGLLAVAKRRVDAVTPADRSAAERTSADRER
ncbi:MAG: hypothetical protein HKN44_14165 [Ilumatobacter sp.]|nr:hypothetical protein [Ilumatobacter sp.]